MKLKGDFSFNLFEDEPNSSAYHGSNESDFVMAEVGLNEVEENKSSSEKQESQSHSVEENHKSSQLSDTVMKL